MSRHGRIHQTRRAVTLIEVIAALGVAAIAMVAAAQLSALATQQTLRTRKHRAALQEAENAMEQLLAIPYSELTNERVQQIKLSSNALRQLNDGALEVTLSETGGAMASKRLEVRVGWSDGTGNTKQDVALRAWKYQQAQVTSIKEPRE